jgi:hypothetical protein
MNIVNNVLSMKNYEWEIGYQWHLWPITGLVLLTGYYAGTLYVDIPD